MSFEHFVVGDFNPQLSDQGAEDGHYHWLCSATQDVATVTGYLVGEAYDYEAKGLTRNPYLEDDEYPNEKYLTILGGAALHRAIFERLYPTDAFSNVVVRTGSRESIYCDMLVKFTICDGTPAIDSSSRLAVWAQSDEVDEMTEVTNLFVSAGYYTNDFKTTLPRTYRLDVSTVCPNGIDPSVWHRLTIRAHGDVSAGASAGLGGFSIYIDGVPISALEDDYEICAPTALKSSWLSAEARALHAARRLFPALSQPGTDAAQTISGLIFSGNGSVDDISFSSEDPGYAKPEATFALEWDAGVKTLRYAIDNGPTNTVASVDAARSVDILIGSAPTNGLTLKIVECTYWEDRGFERGVWYGTDGATLTNETEFVFDGTTRSPRAVVASTRDYISIGKDGTFTTFKAALEYLDLQTNAIKTLVLSNDIVVSRSDNSGSVRLDNAEGCYQLDLNGHTIKGSGRTPTIIVKCQSLLIYDSSEIDPVTKTKKGRVLPVLTYTNQYECFNTSVEVYPQTTNPPVEPVLTIQDGIFDGWVRNVPSLYHENSIVGAIFVEGGSFISTNGATFYLDSCVTNPSLQYVYRDGYWASCGYTNVVIWTGLGDGRRWVDPENWKGHRLPTATETALFPSRAEGVEPWTVDVEDGQMTTTTLWLEGDIRLSGTNDFADVTLTGGGEGLICGDALLIYDGTQPGALTNILLRSDWAGTVLLKNIGYPTSKAAARLKNIETWGTADSTVVFNGVRGYVMDTYSHTMAYDFVLRDYVYQNAKGATVTNIAWRNDSGYSLSTLAFLGELSGDGTFQTASNIRPILQLIKFASVTNYTGKLDVSGKRVLIGDSDEVALDAGLIAFGNLTVVNADSGWMCRTASFGETLYVMGETNDVIVTCSVTKPDISGCTNVFLNLGIVPKVKLACTATKPYAVSVVWDPSDPEDPEPSSLTAAAPVLSALAASPVSAGSAYRAAAFRPALAVAQAAVVNAVEEANVSIEIGADAVRIVVSNTEPGLWYGVRHRASLDADWEGPSEWTRATDSTVSLELAKSDEDASGFYGVVVAYEDPGGGGGQ